MAISLDPKGLEVTVLVGGEGRSDERNQPVRAAKGLKDRYGSLMISLL